MDGDGDHAFDAKRRIESLNAASEMFYAFGLGAGALLAFAEDSPRAPIAPPLLALMRAEAEGAVDTAARNFAAVTGAGGDGGGASAELAAAAARLREVGGLLTLGCDGAYVVRPVPAGSGVAAGDGVAAASEAAAGSEAAAAAGDAAAAASGDVPETLRCFFEKVVAPKAVAFVRAILHIPVEEAEAGAPRRVPLQRLRAPGDAAGVELLGARIAFPPFVPRVAWAPDGDFPGNVRRGRFLFWLDGGAGDAAGAAPVPAPAPAACAALAWRRIEGDEILEFMGAGAGSGAE